ncbi:MAG TPA: hypothetical protein VHD60_00160 [Candidatus Saccharimonadales bacterium]|nr:hypothetical protein [Candidatus Saccharimonadales bacterium]
MKLFSRMFNSLPKRLAAAGLIALAVFIPSMTLAASTVKIEANTTVSNASENAGTMNWGSSASATYNQVVAVQVAYDNTETANSGKNATNLHVKINIPSAAGQTQTITTKVSSDNSNTVNGSATVKLDRADAYLQYIPGTATWKHATSPNGPMTTTQKISDDVVLSANGINLGNGVPCQAGSIVVQAREMIPGLTVDKFVREAGTTSWSRSITAKPGDTLQYEIAYHNTGNTNQQDVEFRDQLPKGVTYVAGSTFLKDSQYPNGTNLKTDAVVSNGITTGTYLPGAAGYVMFSVKVNSADTLQCGTNLIRNLAFVQPKDMNYYYNTADVTVNKTCTPPKTPTYACSAFHVTKGDNRTVSIDKFVFTASNKASLSSVDVNWGDNTALTTNKVIGQTHQYGKDGTYTISLSNFKVNGKTVDVAGDCSQAVTFTSKPTIPGGNLPNTGAGNVIGLFAAITVAGAFAHRLFLSRKLARD